MTGTGPCAGLCSNPVSVAANANSGNLGAAATCHSVLQDPDDPVGNLNCGNFVTPRTLSINGGTAVNCTMNFYPLPAQRNGGWCVETIAGSEAWAWFGTY